MNLVCVYKPESQVYICEVTDQSINQRFLMWLESINQSIN